MVCLEKKTVRHVNLYIIGSEGLDICSVCDLKIREFIADCRRKAQSKKLESAKRKRREGK
jgi:hypothetical protein